MQTHILVK